jgi:glutaryl-CoA dehydrogenase (non-decarboxylating)
MLNYGLNEVHLKAQVEFQAFTNRHIDPFADQWDKEETCPQNVIEALAEAGYLGATTSKHYGGSEMDPITFGLLCEELGKSSFSLVSLLTVHGMVCQAIKKWGSNKQQEYWLPKLASGKTLAAFALSEPDFGSDPNGLETTAAPIGKESYLLSGKKKWISCGQIADLFLVFAKCEGYLTAFLLNRNTSGFNIKPLQGMYGFRSAMLAELSFDNCLINKEDIVGKIGFGFSHVGNTALDYGRYCIAWGSVGLGQACLNASLSYATKRKQFGVYLHKHQLIQQMIANMTTNIRAARALCLHAACLKLRKEPDLIMETSIAKYFASRMALNAANDTVQIHGANGCSSEYPVQRYLRDAKITEIIEGSSQMQQIIISQYAHQNFLFTQGRNR